MKTPKTKQQLNAPGPFHGPLPTGRGLSSGVVALILGILCFLGVLAFHFPQYLTTPELRKQYDVATIRLIMYWAMVVAGGIWLANILVARTRWLAGSAFFLVAASALLGGAKVPVSNFA